MSDLVTTIGEKSEECYIIKCTDKEKTVICYMPIDSTEDDVMDKATELFKEISEPYLSKDPCYGEGFYPLKYEVPAFCDIRKVYFKKYYRGPSAGEFMDKHFGVVAVSGVTGTMYVSKAK